LTSLYILLARSYIKIKSYDLAIGAYKKCLEINPRKIESLLELASLYHLKYSSKKCLEWLQVCQ
jgi:tetratricopeptide (TPR) repeat protein